MKGQEIMLSECPPHRRIEGIISGTPKPGTMMQVVAATAAIGGRLTYQVYAPGTGDGTLAPRYLLDIDHEQGFTFDTAYVTGTRCFLWQLSAGDEVNVRRYDISGTGSPTEAVAVGDKLLIIDGLGKVDKVAQGVVNSTFVDYPFEAQEAVAALTAEWLVWCRVRY
jgi:hypothetical protein